MNQQVGYLGLTSHTKLNWHICSKDKKRKNVHQKSYRQDPAKSSGNSSLAIQSGNNIANNRRGAFNYGAYQSPTVSMSLYHRSNEKCESRSNGNHFNRTTIRPNY